MWKFWKKGVWQSDVRQRVDEEPLPSFELMCLKHDSAKKLKVPAPEKRPLCCPPDIILQKGLPELTNSVLHIMAHPISLHNRLPGGQQLVTGTVELLTGCSSLPMGSFPSARRKGTFGMPAPPLPESGQSDFNVGICTQLFLEPEDEPGEHFPRASRRFPHAAIILPVPRTSV